MSEQITPSKKISAGLILSWIFGVLFALTGIISVFSEPIPGLVMLIMATVLLPPATKLIDQKWKIHFSKGVKITIVIVGLIILGATVDTSDVSNNQQAETREEGQIANNENAIEEASPDNQANGEQLQAETKEQTANEEKTETIPTPNEDPEPTKEATVPVEYKSALAKADSYANDQHMSKKGLYNQLTSEYGEQFSKEAAQYAVDNVKTDWKANALAKATSYANDQHMSKKGVYDQLVSDYGEQFTKAEAQYAVDNVEADWNANALTKARNYQETQNMSPAAIHDQLVSEYGEQFTKSEADYAIQHLND